MSKGPGPAAIPPVARFKEPLKTTTSSVPVLLANTVLKASGACEVVDIGFAAKESFRSPHPSQHWDGSSEC
jgi:hypothetical protein